MQSYEGNVGDSMNLQCKNGKHIQWYYENFKYNPVSRPIKLGNKFSISRVKSNQSGTYFCYGKYSNRNSHFLSKATVHIYGMQDLH